MPRSNSASMEKQVTDQEISNAEEFLDSLHSLKSVAPRTYDLSKFEDSIQQFLSESSVSSGGRRTRRKKLRTRK